MARTVDPRTVDTQTVDFYCFLRTGVRIDRSKIRGPSFIPQDCRLPHRQMFGATDPMSVARDTVDSQNVDFGLTDPKAVGRAVDPRSVDSYCFLRIGVRNDRSKIRGPSCRGPECEPPDCSLPDRQIFGATDPKSVARDTVGSQTVDPRSRDVAGL